MDQKMATNPRTNIFNPFTGRFQKLLDGAVVITQFSGAPTTRSEPVVTDAEVGTFYQPTDDRDSLYLKTSAANTWVLVNTEVTQVGAPAITSVSEALAFTWMGYGQ